MCYISNNWNGSGDGRCGMDLKLAHSSVFKEWYTVKFPGSRLPNSKL